MMNLKINKIKKKNKMKNKLKINLFKERKDFNYRNCSNNKE